MNKLKKLFVGMLAVIALVCTMVSFSVFATETTVTLENSSIDTSEWNYLWTVSKPTGMLKVGEDIQPADVTVIFPNGDETSDKEFVLKNEGFYTIKYVANVGGAERVLTQEVEVRQELFHVTGKKSRVEYTTYKYSDHATPEFTSERESVVNSEVSGIQVSLASGEEFRFGRVINVSELTKLQNLIKVVMAPNTIGMSDVSAFEVVLTDAHDPTNYITVRTAASSLTPLCYVLTNASNGQRPTGWEFNRDVKHVGSAGTPVRYSFTGPCANTESTTVATTSKSHNDASFGINGIADNDWSLSFDYATKQLHNITSAHASSTTMLVDLDDPSHFEKIWKGFTTGECFLSIKAEGYVADTFNFIITEMYSVPYLKRYAEFNDRLTKEIGIEVDYGIYAGESLPTGKVGVEYPIFNAFAVNPYFGKLNATYQVKLGDTVVCENGEKFIPDAPGTYDLVYTVTDFFKETNTLTKQIVVKGDDYADLTFELVDAVKGGVAGQYITLAETTGHEGGGSVFKITQDVKLVKGVNDFEDVAIKEIILEEDGKDVVKKAFFPAKSGTYKVTITATDYIGQNNSITYDVVIANGDIPVYVDTPTIPKYFISGQTYVLPEIKAYDYTAGDGVGESIETNIVYIDGEGVKTAIDRKIVPIVSNGKTDVQIIYYAKKAGITYTSKGNYTKSVPVFDIMLGNKIDFSKLFVSDGMEIAPDSAGKNMVLKALSGDAKTELINPIGASVVSFKFNAIQGKVNFKSFNITLTDSLNKNEQVKFMYIPNDSISSFFRINDYSGAEYIADKSLSNEDVITLTVLLDQNGVQFDGSGTVAGIEKYVNGEEFKGFSSNKVYLTIGYEGATDAEVVMVNIAGQKIYPNPSTDRVEPAIAFSGDYLGNVRYGEKIRIPNAVVADVIDPNVEGSVTVELPADENGNTKIAFSEPDENGERVYLKDADISREYFIKADTYGSYRVTFTAQDCFGNPLTFNYVVNVVDTTAPIITIPADATATGKVGELITLKNATAIDNVDGAVDVLIFVYSPASAIYQLNAGDPSFKTNAAGTYRVMYVARDAAGNLGIETYKLVVEA